MRSCIAVNSLFSLDFEPWHLIRLTLLARGADIGGSNRPLSDSHTNQTLTGMNYFITVVTGSRSKSDLGLQMPE